MQRKKSIFSAYRLTKNDANKKAGSATNFNNRLNMNVEQSREIQKLIYFYVFFTPVLKYLCVNSNRGS